MTANFQKLGRFGLRALPHRGQHGKRSWNCCALIGAAASSAALAWVVFVTVERAMATASSHCQSTAS